MEHHSDRADGEGDTPGPWPEPRMDLGSAVAWLYQAPGAVYAPDGSL